MYHTKELDDECVTELAVSVGKSRKAMHSILSDWAYDYNTATYLLLWKRKQLSKSARRMRDQVKAALDGVDNQIFPQNGLSN